AGCPDGPVLVRRGPLRDGDGPPAVFWQDLRGDLRRDPEPDADPAARAAPRLACGIGTHYRQGVGEGPGDSLPDGRRAAGRFETAEARFGFGTGEGEEQHCHHRSTCPTIAPG